MLKGNNYFKIFLCLIFLFSFNLNVYAAQELTCLYKKGDGADKVLLTQDSSGNVKIYKNAKNVSWDDKSSYWYENTDKVTYSTDYPVKRDAQGHLTECPPAKHTADTNTGNIVFFGEYEACKDKGIISGVNPFDEPFCDDKLDISSNKLENVYTKQSSTASSSVGTSGQKCSAIKGSKWLNSTNSNTLSCLYAKDITFYINNEVWYDPRTWVNPFNLPKVDFCHVIQLNVGTGVTVYDNYNNTGLNYTTEIDSDFNEELISSNFSGNCPSTIGVYRGGGGLATKKNVVSSSTGIKSALNVIDSPFEQYSLIDTKGKNLVTGDDATDVVENAIKIVPTESLSCDELMDENIAKLLGTLIIAFKILIPIALIVMGSVDFIQAIFSQEEGNMKKAQGKFIKRIIVAIVIFLIPSILKLLLSLASTIWPVIDSSMCGLL